MNLDDRLSAARDEYRSLAVPGADAAPAEVPRTPDPGDPARPERRRSGRMALVAAAAMIALVVAVIVVRPDGADDDAVTVTSLEVAPSDEVEKSDNPPGAVAVYDEQIVLMPEGPYDDGAEVVASVPEGFSVDALDGKLRWCATLADAPGGPAEWCDPTVRELFGHHPVSDVHTEAAMVLPQSVFTPTGWRDCNEDTVVCRVVAYSEHHGDVASVAVEFVGNVVPTAVSLSVAATEPQGAFELTPRGLEADPTWFELSAASPGLAAGLDPFWVSYCAFDASSDISGPYGEFLWSHSGQRSLAPANCDVFRGSPKIDPLDPNATLDVVQPRWIHGYQGWSDCRRDRCFVMVETRTGVTALDGGGTTSGQEPAAVALLSDDWISPVDNRPRITVVTPGPHAAGQTIEIDITGMGERDATNLGVCHVDNPWGCGYIGASFAQMSDGRHEITLPDQMPTGTSFIGADSCPPETCYLELDSQGEGLPPLAVAPLDTDGSV